MRYVVVQLLSGMLLLAGSAAALAAPPARSRSTRSVWTRRRRVDLLVAFGIKCAFPLLHNWLQDAYPEATATGTVLLSAFTTKLGIYALARGFPGTELLIWIGTAMAAFPIFYAVIENDLRRVLAYSMNNQLGFMVVGIGIGTELALNGAVAHAFADILFKGLLFMSMGAVLLRAGTVKGSELGGLYKSMPWTTGFCMVGAASISAFPLFSGFVTKSMIMTAAAQEGHLCSLAGAAVRLRRRVPPRGHQDSVLRVLRPRLGHPLRGSAAEHAVGHGDRRRAVHRHRRLPGGALRAAAVPVTYEPYTASHVVAQLQLLLFSALAFAVLMRTGIYPPELRSVNLDSDWFYRRLLNKVWHASRSTLAIARMTIEDRLGAIASRLYTSVYRHYSPESGMAGTSPTQEHGAVGARRCCWGTCCCTTSDALSALWLTSMRTSDTCPDFDRELANKNNRTARRSCQWDADGRTDGEHGGVRADSRGLWGVPPEPGSRRRRRRDLGCVRVLEHQRLDAALTALRVRICRFAARVRTTASLIGRVCQASGTPWC